MSTVRIQVRRGTAAQWTSVDPVLEAGEMGLESDTNYIKFGNGTDVWSELGYANDPGFLDLTNSLVNYVEVADIGAVSGVAGLDSNKNLIVPGSSIIIEGTTANDYETTLVVTDPTADRTITFPNATGTVALTSDINALIDGAPDALNTLNELAAAINDDANFVTTIFTALSNKQELVDSIGDEQIGALLNISGNIQTQLDGKQAIVSGVSNTEIGYLDGVTSSIQSQINAKLDSTTAATTYQVIVSGVSDTEIGYLDGVNSAIQTQLNNKQSIVANVSDTEIGYLDGVTSAIQTQINSKASTTSLSNHESDTTNIHGIADTADLATKAYADGKASDAQTNAITAAGIAAASAIATAVTNHENDTTNVHGIADTSVLVTSTQLGLKQDKVTGVSDTEIGYLDGVTSAIQTQINSKAATSHSHSQSDVTNLTTDLASKLNLSGGTMTGALTLSGAPTSDLHAATKLYVDGIAAGINFHQPVVAATSGNLAGTYSNGTNGVGATITAGSNGAIGTIDGASVSVGNRILLRAQTDAKQNGVYTVTAVGSAGAPWVVTRATDADNNPSGELSTGDFTFVTSGSTNGSKGFILSTTGTIVIGTTEISYTQFNASEAVVAGTNISKSGETISVVNNPTFSGLVTASASGVAFSDGTQTKQGVPSQTIIIQKTAAYTLSDLAERDDLIEVSHTGGSAVDITIPADSTLNFPIGTSIDILRTNTGGVRIVGAGGVTVNSTPGAFLRAQWSSATLFKRAANTWVLIGDLATA